MLPESTRFLVVDDFKTMRKMISKALRGMGLENISEADDGNSALAVLKEAASKGEPIDIVLSDWNMPGKNGLEFLKAVRADDSTKGLPFIMITAEGEQHQIIEAVKTGVTDFIVKPFTPDTLRAKLEKLSKKTA